MPSYYPPHPPAEGLLTKKGIWVLLVVGTFFMWVGWVISIYGNAADRDVMRFAQLVFVSGGLWNVLSAVAGALGSRKTSDWQNVGLLVLAAFFALAVATARGI